MTTVPACLQMAILFRTIEELNSFKRESGCNDFYIDKDLVTLVGEFTAPNLILATGKYNGMVSMNRDLHLSN